MSPTQQEEPSERSPLLGDQNGSANGHVVDSEEQSNANAQPNGTDEVVLAEEPTTKQFILTMLVLFVGVFFAALGRLTPSVRTTS